jgi:hypothetical protein
MILCKIITNQADDVGESDFIASWIGTYRPVGCNHVEGFNAEDLFPGNFVAMETRASLVFSVWCLCFSSKTCPALHSKTLNMIAEMSCFIWVLRRISLIIAENVQLVNNSLCKRLI